MIEYGLKFRIPHRNAEDAVWMPDLEMVAHLSDSLSYPVWREVGEWTDFPVTKPVN